MYRNRNKNIRNKNVGNLRNDKDCLNTINEDRSVKITRSNNNRTKEADIVLDSHGNSEEDIPASQEPTQRYLSQRSNIALTLGRTQSRLHMSQRQPNNYFEMVLMKAGVQLEEEDSFVITCDHIIFVSRLRDLFVQSNPNFQDHLEMFKNGLKDAWSNLSFKLLTGCIINLADENITYHSQTSMLSNFFMIDFLCDIVLNVLFEKIEQYACQQKSVISIVRHGNDVPILPLMLSQLRYICTTHSDVIFDHIKRLLEKIHYQSKWDIIASAEFILIPRKHDDFVQLLLDNLSDSNELFQSIGIQTLINLELSSNMQGRIRSRILTFIRENQCSISIFPLLVRFLLKDISSYNDDMMQELVNAVREVFSWPEKGPLADLCSDKNLQVELFGYVEAQLLCTKRFYSMWQKTLTNIRTTQFKPVDFVMVLLLIYIQEDNSNVIVAIMRRHLKSLPTSIIRSIRNIYSPMLNHHWYILIEMLNSFLQDKQKSISEFAQETYRCFFEISDSVQKLILNNLLDLICERSSENTKNFSLQILRHLCQLYPKILHKWGMLLLPCLHQVHEMSLSQTRIVIELLSSVAYPVPTLDVCPSLQDQIDMFIKKQIINHNLFVKKQGIIGGIQLIDCIARIEEKAIQHDELEVSYGVISDLPEGRSKLAANYIERIQSAATYSPECLGLFFDELASVCNSGSNERANNMYYDKPFLIWLCEVMTVYFQNSFIAEYNPEKIDGINLVSMKCINSPLDANTDDIQSELPSIAINIGELVLKPSATAISSILVLNPLFNLVRVLQMQRYERSLEIINALLGCAIILPDFFEEPNFNTIFNEYDEEMQKKILNIYFHCANWMRETIAAFATQRQDMLKKKVLQRLGELIKVEAHIKEMLLRAPKNYSPPQCQFLCDATWPSSKDKSMHKNIDDELNDKDSNVDNDDDEKRPRKKAKPNNDTQETILSEMDTSQRSILPNKDSRKVVIKNTFDSVYGPKEVYRQMAIDIILVLKENLTLEYPLPVNEIGTKMGLLEFRFILKDIVIKLESVVGIQKFHSEQSLQYIDRPDYFLCDLSNFIKTIVQKMNMISSTIINKLEEIGYKYSNGELFSERLNLMKVCYGLCLRLLVAYFSWSQWFKNEHHIKKLQESLLVFMEKNVAQRLRNKAVPILAVESFSYILKYEKNIIDLKSAVHLYQLLDILNVLSDKSAKEKQLQEMRSLCRSLLSRKWFNYEGLMERGANCNIYLNDLVKGFVRDSDFLKQKEIMLGILNETDLFKSKENSLKSFPNITGANFPLLYRALCDILIKTFNEKLLDDGIVLTTNDQLLIWETSSKLLIILLEVAQNLNIPRNFQIYMKYSRIFIRLALQRGLQLFEKHIKGNPERICELIKNTQIVTRFLHHLCCHSKALKSTLIINQIPALRETVENYTFRVKALLTANKCSSVFLMGNLKNKDLHGDDLLSQASLEKINSANHEDSDEDIPDDDISIEETIVDNDANSTNISNQTASTSSNETSCRSKCF